jgi:hypothetical protein
MSISRKKKGDFFFSGLNQHSALNPTRNDQLLFVSHAEIRVTKRFGSRRDSGRWARASLMGCHRSVINRGFDEHQARVHGPHRVEIGPRLEQAGGTDQYCAHFGRRFSTQLVTMTTTRTSAWKPCRIPRVSFSQRNYDVTEFNLSPHLPACPSLGKTMLRRTA